jgi:hypothetical protein
LEQDLVELITLLDDCSALLIESWQKQKSDFVVKWTIVVLLLEEKCSELLEDVVEEEIDELVRPRLPGF